MKIYRIPRPLGYLYAVLGTGFLIIISQFYAVGMVFISDEIESYIPPLIMLTIALGLFYGAWYFYRYQIVLLETGITIFFPFKKPKMIEWMQIETIKFRKRLFCKPKLVIQYRKNDKIKEQKLIKSVEPYLDLINELYLIKGIPIPKKVEKYINRTRTGYKRWKELMLAILYFILGLAGIMLYRQTIPYGPGLPSTFFYIILWMLGHSLLWFHIALAIKYASGKTWTIAVLLSIFFLSVFGLFQITIDARETPMIVFVSVMTAILFAMVTVSLLKNRKTANYVGYSCSLLLFLLFFFGYSALIPQANIKQIAELLGPYGSGGTVYWTPDGNEVILDAMIGDKKPVWNFISVNTTRMLQKPILDKNGNPRYIYYPIWSPDGTKFLADAFLSSETTYIQSIVLGDYQTKQFEFLDARILPRRDRYIEVLHPNQSQPWSPDGRSAIIWRPEYTSDTSELTYKLYYYSFDKDTSKVIYQTKEKVKSAFWAKDTTILYLTYIERKLGRGQLDNLYTLWQIKVNDREALSPQNRVQPEKLFTDKEPWQRYGYSPMGRYLYINLDTTTTVSQKYYILNTQTREKILIPYAEKDTTAQIVSVTWHPREDKMLYSIGNLDKSEIYEFNLADRKSRLIHIEKGEVRYLRYSGTGNRIAYYVGKLGHWPDAIISIKTNGTDWRRVVPSVTSANFYLEDPTFAWQPTGDVLAFLIVPWTARDIWKMGVYTATFK